MFLYKCLLSSICWTSIENKFDSQTLTCNTRLFIVGLVQVRLATNFSDKNKVAKIEIWFCICYRTLHIFWNEKYGHFWLVIKVKRHKILWISGTKLTITHKLEIGKLIFHSFQHIAHLSCRYGHSWGKHFIQAAFGHTFSLNPSLIFIFHLLPSPVQVLCNKI